MIAYFACLMLYPKHLPKLAIKGDRFIAQIFFV